MINIIKNIKIPKNIWLLGMFPIYFGTEGILKLNRNQTGNQENLFFPLSFFLGFIIFCILFLRFISGKVNCPGWIKKIFFFYIFSISFCIIGIAESSVMLPILSYLQFISGFLGVIIALWVIREKRVTFPEATYYVSILYLILIALNLLQYMLTDGIEFSNRYLYSPGTPWWSIAQPWIYYPAIVSCVFLFAAPIWREKLHPVFFYLMYLAIAFYIILFGVRTPLVTYIIGLIGYIIIFSKHRKATIIIMILLVILGIFLMQSGILNIFLKSLGISSRSFKFFDITLSGRNEIFKYTFDSIKNDPLYLFIGNAFKGREIRWIRMSEANITIRSLHNQYLELIDLGGLSLLIGFLYCVLKMLKIIYKKTKIDNRFVFWLFLITIQLVIDLNLNIPIRNTNPAIMYWFYWAGCCIYAQNYYIFHPVKYVGDTLRNLDNRQTLITINEKKYTQEA